MLVLIFINSLTKADDILKFVENFKINLNKEKNEKLSN
jgi:hypothetical protein